MSRKMLGKSFPYEKEAGDEEPQTNGPSFVPWSNPNEVHTTDGNTTQDPVTPGTRRVVSFKRHQDTSPGAEALSMPGRHPPVFMEQTRPGAFSVQGFDSDEGYRHDRLTVEEWYDEQATTSSHEESTVRVIARAVDTEEENRIRHERDQLHQMFDNVLVVNPAIATHRDVENGDENIHANNLDGLQRSDDPNWGIRSGRWFAIGAILVIIVVAVTVALVLHDPTPPPDPTPPLVSLITELLSSVSSDGGEALSDLSTPQGKAFNWLRDDPDLGIFSNETIIQRYALATLFYSANGASWDNNAGWLDRDEECSSWHGLDCTTAASRLALNLDLYENNLSGRLPPEIGLLTSLTDLTLSKNKLTGPIPTEIGSLVDLANLKIYENELTGTIPTEIHSLINLVKLNLSVNPLTGVIPTEILSFFNLSDLVLSKNNLTGPIPFEIGSLTKLAALYLSENRLTGMVPTEIGSLDILARLYLDNNLLTGTIPTEFGSLELDRLYLQGNNFTGSYACPLSIEKCAISCEFNDTSPRSCCCL